MMTDRAEIERLLNQTGRTLEGLPERYSQAERENAIKRHRTGDYISDRILRQSDVIELLVGALRDALDKPMRKPLTITEANLYQDPVWIEFRYFAEASMWRAGLCDALNWAKRIYRGLQSTPQFGVHYRIWAFRPTIEECEATPWEDG